MLNNFFKINLPYGIEKNHKDEWIAFNREYKPIGWNNLNSKPLEYEKLPFYTSYLKLDEKLLLKVAGNESAIRRDEHGKIYKVFFYHDGTNPVSNNKAENWDLYFKKIMLLSTIEIDESKKAYKPISELSKFGENFVNDKRFSFFDDRENIDNLYHFSFKGKKSKIKYCVINYAKEVSEPTKTPLKLIEITWKKEKQQLQYIASFSDENDLIRFFKNEDANID